MTHAIGIGNLDLSGLLTHPRGELRVAAYESGTGRAKLACIVWLHWEDPDIKPDDISLPYPFVVSVTRFRKAKEPPYPDTVAGTKKVEGMLTSPRNLQEFVVAFDALPTQEAYWYKIDVSMRDTPWLGLNDHTQTYWHSV